MSRPRLATAIGAVVAAAIAGGCGDDSATTDRQAAVAERGAEVMPFDLDATTHVFTPTPDGGIQAVVADSPDDQHQIDLIRRHLQEERDAFARGDFDDPAAIHGHDMPGVDELEAGYTDVSVTYEDRPDGAQLTYTADDRTLVDAIHAWFDRQLADHGSHAEGG